jgi:hypothetical protein
MLLAHPALPNEGSEMKTPSVFRLFLVSSVTGVLLLTNVDLANAKVLRWELDNVTFEGNGTATGFVSYDATAPTQPGSPARDLIDWDITMGGSSLFSGLRFTPGSSGGEFLPLDKPDINIFLFYYDCRGAFVPLCERFQTAPPPRGDFQLVLEFPSSLTDAGRVALTHNSTITFTYMGPYEYLTSGYLVAVPEPSQALVLLIGLAGVAVMLIKQR